MGWTDSHLHRFRMYGNDFGVYQISGPIFDDVAANVHLVDFQFWLGERFLYEYDFGNRWQRDIRLEQILPIEAENILPGLYRRQTVYTSGRLRRRLEIHPVAPALFAGLELAGGAQRCSVAAGDADAMDAQIEQIRELLPWLKLDRFDRRAVNRRLAVCHWRQRPGCGNPSGGKHEQVLATSG